MFIDRRHDVSCSIMCLMLLLATSAAGAVQPDRCEGDCKGARTQVLLQTGSVGSQRFAAQQTIVTTTTIIIMISTTTTTTTVAAILITATKTTTITTTTTTNITTATTTTTRTTTTTTVPSSQPVAKSVCMLVPVYPAHFAALAARMEMIRRTNTGPVVKSVVVFGDAAEHTDFCNRHPAACSEGTGFHAMNLDQLLGKEAHKALESSLGMQQPYSDFEYKGERFECEAKSSGRVYQTVKKFYGAAFGPEACSTYWVCDAESLPFRKHNLSEHLELNARFPQLVISGWHDEPKCAKVQVDDGTDQSCAVLMSNVTNGMRDPSDTKKSIFSPQRWKQVFFCLWISGGSMSALSLLTG
ncbi:unnamed protein product [Polarella glacialis]|uniref:Uncharacterized protein n=1 Tax=Polarella glacialis TaxID=89957 RepID=A0A813GGQ6_POLGL|nr:unnamed protein product [Polarella glacialis]